MMTACDHLHSSLAIIAAILLGALLACTAGLDLDKGILARTDSLLAVEDTAQALSLLRNASTRPDPSPEILSEFGALLRLRNTIRSRLESQKVLERGLRLHPRNPRLTLELGMTYYEQTFYGDAERCFIEASKYHDTKCDAYHYLGLNSLRKWLRNQNHRYELEKAREHLESAVRCNPDSVSWLFDLAFVSYAQRDTNRCNELCITAIRRNPRQARFYLLLGTTAFDARDYRRADSLFFTALSLLGSSEREHLLDISTLLGAELESAYESSSFAKRDFIRRRFWIEHDPDPTTPLNESYLGHLTRVFLADLYFSPPRSPKRGSDSDRGTALIKLGWPDQRSFDLGQKLEGRNETWVYFLEDGALSITFQDEFLNDDFSIPTSDRETKRKLEDAPYRPRPPDLPLFALSADVIVFRNEDATATVATVVHSVREGFESPRLASKETWKLRTSVFDDRWDRAFLSDELLRRGRDICSGDGIFFIESFRIPFDVFHAFFSLRDSSGSITARTNVDFSTLGYLSDSLMLSDILMLGEKRGNLCRPTLKRAGEELSPSLSRDIVRDGKLAIYFEIYNLSLGGRGSAYNVSYLVYPLDTAAGSLLARLAKRMAGFLHLASRSKPAIAQIFHRRENSDTSRERITLDIASLPPGDYELLIIVKDAISGATARSGTAFHLASGSERRRQR